MEIRLNRRRRSALDSCLSFPAAAGAEFLCKLHQLHELPSEKVSLVVLRAAGLSVHRLLYETHAGIRNGLLSQFEKRNDSDTSEYDKIRPLLDLGSREWLSPKRADEMGTRNETRSHSSGELRSRDDHATQKRVLTSWPSHQILLPKFRVLVHRFIRTTYSEANLKQDDES